jgi:heavy metal translocating P-type ATPase
MMLSFAEVDASQRGNETFFRRGVLALALVGLAAGLVVRQTGYIAIEPRLIWGLATAPVLAVLAISIIGDFTRGRLGVDAIALVSMSAALALGETLAALVVAIMYAGGTVLEDFARGRAERNLRALADRSPRLAHRRRGNDLDTISAEQVAEGDELLVRAGEQIPVDGLLVDRLALIDESAVTGEPLPQSHLAGNTLRSGTVNAGEAFVMQATATVGASTYAGILRMVAAAQTAKAPFIRMADRFAVFMLPATLVVSGLAWHLSGSAVRALAVLVVATPCPLILAAPVAFIGGISRAAREGIVMKGSAALEKLASIRTAVFDKTGTLTVGGAELIDADPAPGRDPEELLRLLASLEQASHHVVAESIVKLAREQGLSLVHPDSVREFRGSGLSGVVGDVPVLAGTQSLVLGELPLPVWAVNSETRYRGQPVLRVFVAVKDQLAGIFTFGDSLRAEAPAVTRTLRAAGVSRVVMLTGDDAKVATRIAAALDLDAVIAKASPGDKVDTIEGEKARAPTMMVGDGINDAPALAAATVGIALGARGATASSEAADVVVLPNRLQPVADAILIAQRTRRIALQSILVGLTLSAGAMVAAAFGFIQPVAGALLQELIDVAVILNALRTLRGGVKWRP